MIALPAKFFVGAYAASPSLHNPWDPKTESDFMAGLREMGAIAGLELGFYGDLHRHDTDWFLTELKPTWNFVLTCIPGTMENLKVDPAQGLASESVTGRQGALAFARR